LCFAGKAKRLKAAKEEAKTEIEAYRGQIEQKYKEREKIVCIIFILMPSADKQIQKRL